MIDDIAGLRRVLMEAETIAEAYLAYAERLEPHVTDTSLLISDALRDGKNILFEGAQGTLLDVDHGTYPFVTSSHPTAGERPRHGCGRATWSGSRTRRRVSWTGWRRRSIRPRRVPTSSSPGTAPRSP